MEPDEEPGEFPDLTPYAEWFRHAIEANFFRQNQSHTQFWVLEDGAVRPAKDSMEAVLCMESDRSISRSKIGAALVSTAFLCINHNFWDDGPPILFETMIFGEPSLKGYLERYSDLEEAMRGHEKAVRRVEEAQSQK